MALLFRKYENSDLRACEELFMSNCPPFFDLSEHKLFLQWLAKESIDYFVIEEDKKIEACGGYYENEQGEYILSWGMVRRDKHKQNLGKMLLGERLNRIADIKKAQRVISNTTQYSSGFFGKYGFQLTNIVENFWAPDLHKYEMILNLNTWTTEK